MKKRKKRKVVCVIIDAQKSIVIVKKRGIWHLPGGMSKQDDDKNFLTRKIEEELPDIMFEFVCFDKMKNSTIYVAKIQGPWVLSFNKPLEDVDFVLYYGGEYCIPKDYKIDNLLKKIRDIPKKLQEIQF